jgi:transcriptional regulator with XRE-family HTH domain
VVTKDLIPVTPWHIPAQRLLAENITALLIARNQKQKDLAFWCRHSEVWISKFLHGEREVQLKDLDRIADFFGLVTYQLFQPGISAVTERRIKSDRRKATDRRIGHTHRVMENVRAEVERVRPPRPKRTRDS